MPKTGSTFACTVIRSIHARREDPRDACIEIASPNIKVPGRGPDQHGTFDQIPLEHRAKPILTVVRNPFEKLCSSYRFGWWKETPGIPLTEARYRFSSFPELSFDEYLDLSDMSAARKLGGRNDLRIGNQTLQFIQMYFRDAPSVLRRLTADYVLCGQYARDLPRITFIQSERLNDELADYLAATGYSASEVKFCRQHPRVNITTSGDNVHWTPHLINRIAESEKLLLHILSDLGLHYIRTMQSNQTADSLAGFSRE
jgi:hypothetical protein